jgi:hypothetical protein
MIITKNLSAALVVAVCVGSNATGQVTTSTGFDRIAGTSISAATNALSAEANWLSDAAAIDVIHTADFESMAAGASGRTLVIAPGVTASSSYDPFYPHDLAVASGPIPSYGPLNGFNTTSGGSQHLRYLHDGGSVLRGTVTLTFDRPVSAFSFFMTGEGNVASWDWGSTNFGGYSVGDYGDPYWPSIEQPNARFGGFVDQTGAYTTIGIGLKWDSSDLPWRGSFSLDDIRWVCTPVPEPGTFAMMALLPLVAPRRGRWFQKADPDSIGNA